ncbi:MAG: transaldolase [Chloroflexota bacterium]
MTTMQSSSPIQQLHALGQSIWYDNIERRLLLNGGLARLVADGDIRGLTSNPSIFHNAIARSQDYDNELRQLAAGGCSAEEIYEALAIADIQAAADLLRPLYDQTQGADGYVSLEVSPYLAHDADGTLQAAKRLWQAVARPNLMIKIPATLEGLGAIRAAIASDLNVNVTLIFSISRYRKVMDAYLSGLEDRLAQGKALDGIASVASFFLSRIDTKVDKRLDALAAAQPQKAEQAAGLHGKLAIASARAAYAAFRETFGGPRFARLSAAGARLQRPLWASTSTKNPAYPDTLYIDNLIGPDTVNTLPPVALDAFRDHGKAALSIDIDLAGTQAAIEDLGALGISLDEVTAELEAEGVQAFAQAYTDLLKAITLKMEK